MKEKELTILSDIEIYKLVLDRKIKRFPMYFWEKPDSIESAKHITRYLFENILNWDQEKIKSKLTNKTLSEHKLGGMLTLLFNSSTFEAIDNAYPNVFKRWEMVNIRVPKEYWNEDTALEAMKWLIEEKLQWNNEHIKENLNTSIFSENGLLGLLDVFFNSSPYLAINLLYPGRFQPWEMKNVPQEYWNEHTSQKAIIWLFEEKLKWTDDDIREKLTRDIFLNNGLRTPLKKIYNDSLFEAINSVYPDRFKKNELYGYIHPNRIKNLRKED